MRRRLGIVLLVVVLLAAGAATVAASTASTYQLKVTMPTATGIFEGADVMVAGEEAGKVSAIEVRDNAAMVTVDLDHQHEPLHTGTVARISWQSVLGYRVLELVPGPKDNPELPSGKLIESATERVEVDDLLATLDEPTRAHLQGFIQELEHTLGGKEPDLQSTIKTAGPAVQALGQVMRAVGEDGPALRDLVVRLNAVTAELAQHDTALAGTVGNLGALTQGTVNQQQALSDALRELPSTLREATSTLDQVPAAVNATDPLLKTLRPATARLPEVAGNLDPALADLQPALADLRPLLVSAGSLLDRTPGLLDRAHQVLPGATQAISTLSPAVAFLRPYTPELTGWLTNWTSLFGSQGSGNYGRALIFEGATSFNDNQGILPPGVQQAIRPEPGSIAGQPWIDAYGDGMR